MVENEKDDTSQVFLLAPNKSLTALKEKLAGCSYAEADDKESMESSFLKIRKEFYTIQNALRFDKE